MRHRKRNARRTIVTFKRDNEKSATNVAVYTKDRAGRNCGNRSAYSKPRGKAPLCYEKDVTQKPV